MITDPRASFFRKPWVRVRSTVAMPPYSVMRITGALQSNGEIVYTVATPNATSHDWYLINGPFAINATTGMEGLATFLTTGGYVRYDDANTPTLGEQWGPAIGSLEIVKGGSGFWIVGGIETVAGNSVVVAIQSPAQSKHSFWAEAGTVFPASTSDTQVVLDNSSESNGAHCTLASEIVTINTAGVYSIGLRLTNALLQYVRNDRSELLVKVQHRDDSGSAWTTRISSKRSAYHPDVAVGAGGGTVNHSYNDYVSDWRKTCEAGEQLRVATALTYFSTMPAASISIIRLLVAKQ